MEETEIKRPFVKISLFGDTLVGKTAIVGSILGLYDNLTTLATVGVDKSEIKIKLKNNENINLAIYDVGGNFVRRFGNLNFMRGGKGIILVFSFIRKESFDNLNNWIDFINEHINNPYIVLFGNHADIEKNKWKVTSEEANKFAKEKGFAYFEVSAKTGQGINEGLSYIANEIYDKLMENNDEKGKDKINNNIMMQNNNDKIKSNKNSNCTGNKNGKNNKK